MDISKITGVNHSTIHRWRGEEGYKEMVAEWQQAIVTELAPMIEATLATYGSIVQEAAAEIRRKLAAELPDGGPNEAVRSAALKLLFDSPMVKRLYTLPGKDDDGTANTAAPVVLHVHLGTDGQPVIDATETAADAEFTELPDAAADE